MRLEHLPLMPVDVLYFEKPLYPTARLEMVNVVRVIPPAIAIPARDQQDAYPLLAIRVDEWEEVIDLAHPPV